MYAARRMNIFDPESLKDRLRVRIIEAIRNRDLEELKKLQKIKNGEIIELTTFLDLLKYSSCIKNDENKNVEVIMCDPIKSHMKEIIESRGFESNTLQ